MYYLLLELPFNITLVWGETFGSFAEAEARAATLPHGFVVSESLPDTSIFYPLEEQHEI